jgi:hypothetical protein
MFWIIVIGLVVIFIIIGVTSSNKEKNIKEELKAKGLNFDAFVSVGTYVGGHPDRNENVDNCFANKESDTMVFYRKIIAEKPERKFSINIENIKNITVEDASSIEKKITVGRLLLVGVFALAWRKKKTNELAFVVTEWNDGKFDHSTTFSFEGKEAMTKANTARNSLIKMCN